MKRYTVLHAIETAGPGGAETVLLDVASGINRDKYRSMAFLPQGPWLPGQLESRGVPYTISQSNSWHGVIREMKALVERENVDIIHSHLDDQNFCCSIVGKLAGRKTIATFHGAPRIAVQTGLRRSMKLWVSKRYASRIVVVSDSRTCTSIVRS